MATFGEELKRMREAAGIASQRALGDLIGVSGSAVGEWERDESEPTRENLRAIEAAVGDDQGVLAALLGPIGQSIAEEIAELQEQVRQQGQQIAEILRLLDAEDAR